MFLLVFLFTNLSLANCQYSLPYKKGASYRLLQVWNGKHSHQAPLEYGLDFDLKVGTPVYAARSGTILKIKNDSKKVGTSKKFIKDANFIHIKHSDNTFALYAHLKFNGVKVKKGQIIREGELIGYSGNTGFSDSPHLHFEVYRKDKNQYKRRSLPVTIATQYGPLLGLELGKSYRAVKNDKPCP
ncbi:M23 family metallopeptidase [Halobacteriovorax sp. JY17]|uniref:M23 family metallopeptidase n=1 Tax=Halobacteriovorax sp. JY17 TaxID=2014617 RepID=UPI0025BCD785|nr:M23 family metallopeptidase [Halobacteriovorax sp. JY17]